MALVGEGSVLANTNVGLSLDEAWAAGQKRKKEYVAKILYFGTNGSENPTKTVVPFVGANASVEAGDQAIIHLFGDGVVLIEYNPLTCDAGAATS